MQVVQFAGRVEQAAGFQRFGGDAVRIGHVAAGEVAFRAGSRVAAHFPGGDEIVVGAVEVCGAARIGLPGREACHVPVVVGFERLVEVGHASEDPAEGKVCECPYEIGLPDDVVLIDLFGVLYHVDILDTSVRDADDAEHRVGDRTARRGGGPFGDVGTQSPGLDLLRAEPAAAVTHVRQGIPCKTAVVEIDVERIAQLDIDVVAAALLPRASFVDVVEIGLEVIPCREHLIFIEARFGVYVEERAGGGGCAACNQKE